MGSWVNEPQLYYKGGEVHVIHGLDVSKWSYFEAMRVLTELGYKGDGDMKMWCFGLFLFVHMGWDIASRKMISSGNLA